MKTNQMHCLSLIYFFNYLYMFWASLLPIIRRYSLCMYSNWFVLYVLVTGSCQSTKTYNTYQLLYIHSEYLLMMGNKYARNM
jgi:hypothetical protein